MAKTHTTFTDTASGLPSFNGAGQIDMLRQAEYYSETALTGNVTWEVINSINPDRIKVIDCKASSYTITLSGVGITFKGDINSSKQVQGLSTTKSTTIALWALTPTVIIVATKQNLA